MIAFPPGVHVWLATGHTDMRKGFATLALLAATVVLLRRGHLESDRGFDTTPRFAARRLR